MISCFAYKCPMDCSFAGASARFELIKRLLHQMYHGGIPSQDPSSGFPWFSASGFPKLKKSKHGKLSYPTGSMYGIYANIGGILMVNVTIYISIYSIHGSYGLWEPSPLVGDGGPRGPQSVSLGAKSHTQPIDANQGDWQSPKTLGMLP